MKFALVILKPTLFLWVPFGEFIFLKESLINPSITVVINQVGPVAYTHLGIKLKPRVAVVDPEQFSVADKVFLTSGLLVGVGAVPRTLEFNGVLGELQDDGGGLWGLGLVDVAVVIHKGLLVTRADAGVKQLARVAGVVERLLSAL